MSQADVSTPFMEPQRAPARLELASVGEEGDALLSAVASAVSMLRKLFRHDQLVEPAALNVVRRTGEAVEERLARKELRVVVVGERQSGKSTLLDAIVGDRLLGGARGESRAPTFIRHRDTTNYVAKFSSGAVEDFSGMVPDSSGELDEKARLLGQSLADAEQRCTVASVEFRRAVEEGQRAEAAVLRARDELDRVRLSAAGATNELSAAETEETRVQTALVAVERSVPTSLRHELPRWAVWLWLLQLLFVLANRKSWARYQALRAEHGQMRERLLESRTVAEDRTGEVTRLESRMQSLVQDSASARDAASDAERVFRAAEQERDGIRAEIERVDAERERHDVERRQQFLSSLEALCKARAEGATLTELSIDYPARLLPDDVTIIDMPGAFSESAPEWMAIREQVDGCIFVSEVDRAVSESAKGVLRQLREVIPHLLLVLTKVDEAFADAVSRGGDPWQHIEKARRIGTRRFARELGRDPESVLSVAVAAEVALTLEGSELARRFEAEIAKLFRLLRHERAIILGTHAGAAIRRCVGGIAEAEQRAAVTYRERIETLERQRMPLPDLFCEQQLSAIEPTILSAGRDAVSRGTVGLASAFSSLKESARRQVEACKSQKDLAVASDSLASKLSEESAAARRDALAALQADVDRAVDSLAGQLFAALRKQYRLLHDINRANPTSSQVRPSNAEIPSFASLSPDIRHAIVAFNRARYAFGASGMLMGAGAGIFVHPWAVAAGAGLGTLLAFVRRERDRRARIIDIVDAALEKQERIYLEELRSAEMDAASAIRTGCKRALQEAVVRFGRFIAEPIEAEQRAIDEEREKLAELERLQVDLADQDRELERLLKAAADASVGLCR